MNSNSNEIIFRKGDKIVKYMGEIINLDELIDRYGNKTGPYAIMISKNRYEDGGCGSLANTLSGHNNATLSISKGFACLKCVKNIHNGNEIYLSYGKSYKFNEPGVESYTSKK